MVNQWRDDKAQWYKELKGNNGTARVKMGWEMMVRVQEGIWGSITTLKTF